MIVGRSTNDSLFKYNHVTERVARIRRKVHTHWPGLGNMWPGYSEILDWIQTHIIHYQSDQIVLTSDGQVLVILIFLVRNM